MTLKKYTNAIFLIAYFVLTPLTSNAQQTQSSKNSDYGVLNEIIPLITTYRKNVINNPAPPVSTPVTPTPTKPVPIYSAPSAPGKYPLVRWLLPGGSPPAAPYLPPLTCNFDTCPVN
jgi:hypothetical protein